MYTKKTENSFKQKGFVNPETLILTSTNKKTEGKEYDLKEVLRRIAQDGEEIDLVSKHTNTDEDPEEYIE